MSAEPVADLGIQRLVHIEQRITGAEDQGLRARWEFGHELLREREANGGKQLPSGRLSQVGSETGASRIELQRRMLFAERYPTEEEVHHAVMHFGSWHQVVNTGLAPKVELVVSEPSPAPEGMFATFVADPPWRYGNTSTRGAAEDHYPTMSIEELCELDVVPERAADQAHLYLWTTAGHLPEAFSVMDAWGFTYKTYLVWVKPQMGMGNYFRVSTEMVLFGVKGGMRTQCRDEMNWFEAKRAKHSAKPEKFHDLVMKASPGPYLELFSRCQKDSLLTGCRCSRCRLGWETWGNQA